MIHLDVAYQGNQAGVAYIQCMKVATSADPRVFVDRTELILEWFIDFINEAIPHESTDSDRISQTSDRRLTAETPGSRESSQLEPGNHRMISEQVS